MPVGALVGGALSIGGALIGSNSQKKAAQTASDTSLAVAQQNNALAREIYGSNQAALSPFMQRGNAAGNQINALLGLGGTAPTATQPAYSPQPTATQPAYGAASGYTPNDSFVGGFNLPAYADQMGRIEPGQFDNKGLYTNALAQAAQMQSGSTPQAYAPYQLWSGQQPPQGVASNAANNPPPANGQTAQQAAENAFDIFRNSTGYQFRLGEGMNALNSGWAGAGTLQSGAAMRAAQEYGQNFASNEFGNYMGYLGQQQGVGLGGASALAGVGQNYAGMVSQNNNSAGTAAANAALVSGANNPFANVLGTLGGTILSNGIKF